MAPAPHLFWTAADRAEADVLAWELVGAIHDHRRECRMCAAGFPPCPNVGRAIEIAVDWVQGRALRSRAERLRSDQDFIDLGARYGFSRGELTELRARWQAEDAALLAVEAVAA
jgi:hypothetical protein